jgi:hypothetical protein
MKHTLQLNEKKGGGREKAVCTFFSKAFCIIFHETNAKENWRPFFFFFFLTTSAYQREHAHVTAILCAASCMLTVQYERFPNMSDEDVHGY